MVKTKDVQLSQWDATTTLYLRDRLKQARAKALESVEEYHELLFSIERVGYVATRARILSDNKFSGALHQYGPYLRHLAERSDLAEIVPAQWSEWHISFSSLFEIVRIARNDAMHQGAFARHLTANAAILALVLEEALMSDESAIKHNVEHYMVRDPTCALAGHPLSFVRQTMLATSYSYLPVYLDFQDKGGWYIISDYAVAQYLRPATQKERNQRLARTVEEAIGEGLTVRKAVLCNHDVPINEALERSEGGPVLIVAARKSKQLLGIMTPFDVV